MYCVSVLRDRIEKSSYIMSICDTSSQFSVLLQFFCVSLKLLKSPSPLCRQDLSLRSRGFISSPHPTSVVEPLDILDYQRIRNLASECLLNKGIGFELDLQETSVKTIQMHLPLTVLLNTYRAMFCITHSLLRNNNFKPQCITPLKSRPEAAKVCKIQVWSPSISMRHSTLASWTW